KVVVYPVESPAVRREVTSNSEGEFRIEDLLPGNYAIVIRGAGFAETQARIAVVVSSVRDIAVTLKPAQLQQSVTVQGQAVSIATQPVDVTTAVHGGAVTSYDLQT